MSNTKMSDVFALPLTASKGDVLTDSDGLHIAYSCDAKAIALAVNNHDKLVEALQKIVEWDLRLKFRVDYGSNGERDHFRSVAEQALQAIKGDQ